MTDTRANPDRRDMSTVQKLAGASGAVFLLVGILGFIPGITSRFDEIKFLGNESTAELLGLFQVSIFHNLVHVLFGVLGLWAARRVDLSKNYLLWGGASYLALTVYGFLIDLGSDANIVPVNSADNFLHLFLGVAMVGAGLALRDDRRGAARTA